MKLLFLGDSAGTGFGTVTRDLGRALIRRGIDVRFLSLNEDGQPLDPVFDGRLAILGTTDGWLALGAPETATRIRAMFSGGLFEDGWAPDGALIIGDVASIKMSAILDVPRPPGFPIWHYVPIEGVGLPPRWREIWTRLIPVAISEFGATEIAKITGTRPPVVYHGVDAETFHPVSPERPIVISEGKLLTVLRSKAECRAFLRWPAADFIAFRADRHMPRKNYAALFRALAPVLAAHPAMRLLWHCRTIDQGGDLADERSKYGPLAERMQSTGFHDLAGGVRREYLAAMYNAADLYVSTAAEGFGLTIAESLACGVPAVGLDYSAVPEVIGPAGVLVRAGLVDNPYSHFWAVPDERAFREAVEALMADPARLALLGMAGPGHVAKFSWASAAEQFDGLFADTLGQVAQVRTASLVRDVAATFAGVSA